MEDTSGDHLVRLSCSEQGQLEQVVQGHAQSGFEYLKRMKTLDFFSLNFHAWAKLNRITWATFAVNPYLNLNSAQDDSGQKSFDIRDYWVNVVWLNLVSSG